jgi:hypothetical protein
LPREPRELVAFCGVSAGDPSGAGLQAQTVEPARRPGSVRSGSGDGGMLAR